MTAKAAVEHALAAADSWGCVEQRLTAALSEAEASDARVMADHGLGPLEGMAFGVKANLDVAGIPTTAGTTVVRDASPIDATIVAQLRAAGAIPAITTTLAEAAIGSVTANPWTGVCLSPTDPSLNAGGSSGGSAAAVAAGLVEFALGTDTMGSVRIPAACCGIAGWKPTLGAVSTQGLVPLSAALDTVGVLALDCAQLLVIARELMGGPPGAPVRRVGIASLTQRADAAAQAAVEHAATTLRAQGIEVVSIELDLDVARIRRRGLLLCEVEAAQFWGPAIDGEPTGLSDGVRTLLRFGRDASPASLADAQAVREGVEHQVRAALSKVDALLLPTLPGPIPRANEDPPGLADLTAFVNLAGVPAVSLPSSITGDGETIGRSVQLVGRHGADLALLDLAAMLQPHEV